MSNIYDYIVIGAGIGGGAFLTEIAETGASILVLERGSWLKAEKENWDPKEMFINKRYSCGDIFFDKDNSQFTPRMYYYVGGNSKVFGGSAFRFREVDFNGSSFPNGVIPPWAIRYKDMAPFYDKAEMLMHVAGKKGEDITEADRIEYPYKEREHEPYIEKLSQEIKKRGLHPFHLPLAINTEKCRRGSPCDGYPCRIKAKHDAEVSFVRPVLEKYKNVELWIDSFVENLESKPCNNHQHIITGVNVLRNNKKITVTGKRIILAAGAINSALLLLRSKTKEQPQGLANSSGQVGRNYMTHINSVIMAVNPLKKNPTVFQKTLAINDYYLKTHKHGSRLGSIQMRGKIRPANLKNHKNFFIRSLRSFISSRSVEFWLMTEDYPIYENRVYYDTDGKVRLIKNYINMDTHNELIKTFTSELRKIGYTWIHTDLRDIHSVQHQCGTIRFGNDKALFPLNKWCQSFDVSNLYVVDASIFPSSAALNPALTVAANAMRVGHYLKNLKN